MAVNTRKGSSTAMTYRWQRYAAVAVASVMVATLATPALAVVELANQPLADPVVVEGGTATFLFNKDRGSLWVSVRRETSSTGTQAAFLTAERSLPCVVHRVLGNSYNVDCGVVWTVERPINVASLGVDPLLEDMTLSTQLRGKSLKVSWQGSGDVEIRHGNDQGYLLLQSRDGKATGRWGRERWNDSPKATGRPGKGVLYRRVEQP